MQSLPIPSAQSQALSQQLADLIQQKIKQNNGWLDFATFMQMALYTPNLGYYAGGATKFGQAGDFVTAPEISPLFAQTVALQAAQILASSQGYNLIANMLELGAGTGKLAIDLLLALNDLNQLPAQYFILEVSDYLRQVQRENCEKKLPKNLYQKLVWLETLPKNFNGLIIGNEVLDAIPAHILHKTQSGWRERGVAFEEGFVWKDKDLTQPNLAENLPDDLPSGYITEVCPAASALVHSLGECLQTGAILLIDYGFGAAEYYHPQRSQGTLMCHYQHYAHSNPLVNVGLQDVTAHVNFSQIASVIDMPLDTNIPVQACKPVSMRLSGYASQSQFLINCGILDVLSQHSPNDTQYIKLAAAAQKLLSPAEMGELFKVICFAKNIDTPLLGFKSGDKAHTL